MINLNKKGDNLYNVELLHPRYGWLQINDSPMTYQSAYDLSKRAKKWTRLTKKNNVDYVRKSNQYLEEIDLINQELAISYTSGPQKLRLEERRRVLLEYTITLLGSQL